MKVLAWPAFDYVPFNPYNWLLNKNLEKHQLTIIPYTHNKVLTEDYDVWHMHWPAENVIRKSFIQSFIRFIGFFVLLSLAKLKKAKIIWTAHNFKLHDSLHPLLEKLFWKFFPSFVDGYIIHSEYANNILREKHKKLSDTKFSIIYHGHYKEWYPNNIGKSEAKRLLNIDEDYFVFLFLGSIRPYKNIDLLLEAFTNLDGGKHKLIIAGKSNSEKLNQFILTYSNSNSNIIYDRKWIEDDEFQLYFNASDLAVLPYNIPSSGMALLALSFECPILMPSNPMLVEYKEIISDNLIYLYQEKLDQSVLKDIKDKLNGKEEATNNIDHLGSLDWNKLAYKTKQFYAEVLKK